jgi:hypothetical protein
LVIQQVPSPGEGEEVIDFENRGMVFSDLEYTFLFDFENV